MTDIKITGSVAIAEMQPWWFWAAPLSIGSSRDEINAIGRHEITLERQDELFARTQAAFYVLRDTPALNWTRH